jgi:hypothetical protein
MNGGLFGVTFGGWVKLLGQNHFKIDSPYRHQILPVTMMSLRNSLFKIQEDRLFGKQLNRLEVKNPLFILGHWRSGTSLLHNLLAQDEQFAWSNYLQISKPHTFLCREAVIMRYAAEMAPEKRPMDNLEVDFTSPAEDEFGLAQMTLCSPHIAWIFPRNEAFYDRYLTFRPAPVQDVRRWKSAFLLFLRKLTLRYGKPLLLKSPAHTARIRLILDVFPDARFVHIHRNPYAVFVSTQRLYQTSVPRAYLQNPDVVDYDSSILRHYSTLYEAFFEERELIPPGRYVELCFEELEQDMVGQVEKVYGGLGLPGFRTMLPRLEGYVKSISQYQRNRYPSIPEELCQKVNQAWSRSFEEWGYRKG